MKLLQKSVVSEMFGPNANKGFLRQPAAFLIWIKNFKIAAFDFDDQPQFFGQLKLVTIVLRSAIDEVADANRVGFHPRFEVVCTAHTNSGIDAKSICAFGPQALQSGSRRILNCRNVISSAS